MNDKPQITERRDFLVTRRSRRLLGRVPVFRAVHSAASEGPAFLEPIDLVAQPVDGALEIQLTPPLVEALVIDVAFEDGKEVKLGAEPNERRLPEMHVADHVWNGMQGLLRVLIVAEIEKVVYEMFQHLETGYRLPDGMIVVPMEDVDVGQTASYAVQGVQEAELETVPSMAT
jgi:hypothetical protein